MMHITDWKKMYNVITEEKSQHRRERVKLTYDLSVSENHNSKYNSM